MLEKSGKWSKWTVSVLELQNVYKNVTEFSIVSKKLK